MREVAFQVDDKYSIVASLAVKNREELESVLADLVAQDIDILEFRADIYYQEDQEDKLAGVKEALTRIREAHPSLPLLFTFRSQEEGGDCPLSSSEYISLNREILEGDLVDLIDIEYGLLMGESNNLLDLAETHKIGVVLSHHNFKETLSRDEIVKRYRDMLALNPLLAKIALMPQKQDDVLRLLEACRIVKETDADANLVAISMGDLGQMTRTTAYLFGSSWTYASVEQAAAPGQIHYRDLRAILNRVDNQ